MLINIFPPLKSLKNLIINVLIINPQISTVDIKKYLKQVYGVAATYQGINKILIHLVDEKIILKEDHDWKLKPQWIEQIKNTFLSLDAKSIIPFFNPDLKSVSFKTISDAFDFIQKNIENDTLRNDGENIFITHVKNIGFFKLSTKQDRFLKRMAKQNQCYVLVANKNLINRLVGKFLKSLGFHVYYGIPNSNPHTTTIYGGTLYYTYLSEKLNNYFIQTYSKIKKITDSSALEMFDSLKDDSGSMIKFVFETDPDIVEKNKAYLLNLIKNK